MGFVNGILFLFVILGVLAIIYVVFYNKLQTANTKIQQAESIIDDTLRDKYDAMVKINAVYKSLGKSKKDYLKALDELKEQKITNFDLDRKLSEIHNTILQMKNDIQELQTNKDFKENMSSIKKADEKLSAAKTYYNKYTNNQNELVRTFPSNIIARIHGYKSTPFFDGKDMQDDIYDDFKL